MCSRPAVVSPAASVGGVLDSVGAGSGPWRGASAASGKGTLSTFASAIITFSAPPAFRNCASTPSTASVAITLSAISPNLDSAERKFSLGTSRTSSLYFFMPQGTNSESSPDHRRIIDRLGAGMQVHSHLKHFLARDSGELFELLSDLACVALAQKLAVEPRVRRFP